MLERLCIIHNNSYPHLYPGGVDSMLYKLSSNADFMIEARITNLEKRIINNLEQLSIKHN